MDVKNKLFCGDNLKILKNFIPDDSVDLILLIHRLPRMRVFNSIEMKLYGVLIIKDKR